MPKNVPNSKKLLTGACPEAIHLVTKYTVCEANPKIVIAIPIFAHFRPFSFIAPPKKALRLNIK